MSISVRQLVMAGVHPTQAKVFSDPLSAACALWAINTPARIAAFLAQAMHESAGLTRLEENLRFTTVRALMETWPSRFPTELSAIPYLRNPQALANKVYGGRGGNGPPESGDGWDYRGRGIFMLSLKGNYTRAQVELNRPYVAKPELVQEPTDACLTACWFWVDHKLNELADAWNIDRIGTVINRGPASNKPPLHADERRQLSNEAFEAFA